MPEISIIIPALNESRIIVAHVDEVSAYLETSGNTSYEIIVVDDGSTDGMSERLAEAQSSRPWLVIGSHRSNRGRGRAIRTGFEKSRGKFIVCLDADLSYTPQHIGKLLDPLRSDTADMTLASAYHAEGRVINVPSQRAWLSRVGNWILARGLEGDFKTVTCMVRGFKREVVATLELTGDGKELHLEIMQKAILLGFRIVEVPATLEWRDKKRGETNRVVPDIAILKMRRTVLSHLVFNYLSNPGVLLTVPIATLLLCFVVGSVMILVTWIDNLITESGSWFEITRQTLLDGQLSLAIVLFSAIALMIFVAFYFLSFQSKRYFEELYTLTMRMNKRIKELEDQIDERQ